MEENCVSSENVASMPLKYLYGLVYGLVKAKGNASLPRFSWL